MAPGVLFRVIYGTPDPEPWQKNLTRVRPALLNSYQRHKVKNADYPAILPHQNCSVRGSYVTGLTDGDLYRLDIFEGSQYERKQVKVKVLKDIPLDQAADEAQSDVAEEVETETYVWIEDSEHLETEEWDFEHFKKEKMYYWMGAAESDDVEVDEGFADVDRAVAEQPGVQGAKRHDPTGGRGANGHITRQLLESTSQKSS